MKDIPNVDPKCLDCGKVLPDDYTFTYCDVCWDKRHTPKESNLNKELKDVYWEAGVFDSLTHDEHIKLTKALHQYFRRELEGLLNVVGEDERIPGISKDRDEAVIDLAINGLEYHNRFIRNKMRSQIRSAINELIERMR